MLVGHAERRLATHVERAPPSHVERMLADHPETTTGLPHTKLAMWIFLASECMLFGALITTYVLYRGSSQTGPYPDDVFDIPYTSVSSASWRTTRHCAWWGRRAAGNRSSASTAPTM